MKFQDDIYFQNIIVAKFQCPNFRKRTITIKYLMNLMFFFNFSSNITFIIPYKLTQVLSF